MRYTTFSELCESLNEATDLKVMIVHHAGGHHVGIRLTQHHFPISINEAEFNFIFNFIVDHKLTSGFELSTGTGISAIAIGSALKENSGHLITMDSYYEDLTGISSNIPVSTYSPEDIAEVKAKSDCYKFASQTISYLELEATVQIEVGWSPTDSVKFIEKRGTPLDVVFLDCPKDDSEFERDLRSLIPHLNKEKFVIFVHDTHSYTQKSFDLVKELLGIEMVQIYEYFKDTQYYSKRYFPLAVITNIKE